MTAAKIMECAAHNLALLDLGSIEATTLEAFEANCLSPTPLGHFLRSHRIAPPRLSRTRFEQRRHSGTGRAGQCRCCEFSSIASDLSHKIRCVTHYFSPGGMILTSMPAAFALRIMSHVPFEPGSGKARQISGLPSSSIWAFLIGPAAFPCLSQSAG